MIDIGVPRRVAALLDTDRAASVITEALAGAGITVGGDAPWDIQIHDERTYATAPSASVRPSSKAGGTARPSTR